MDITEIIKQNQFLIFLGKNGSGKSTKLRFLDENDEFSTKYITPERGGNLEYQVHVEDNILRNPDFLKHERRKNRTDDFKNQSVAQFRRLELAVLREIDSNREIRDSDYTFETVIQKINDLLPEIEIKRKNDSGFDVFDKNTNNKIESNMISSGESELIALAIEILVFSKEDGTSKLLLLDEPDVHLHPDLQQRLVQFIETTAIENEFKVAIATHSTAVLGAFKNKDLAGIIPIESKDQDDFKSFNIDPVCESILPVFGAHPLSEQFNKTPVLLVEGDDDKRVIEQIVRSSRGRIKLSPCPAGSIQELPTWEKWLDDFLPSIYESPTGYSLRDLDDSDNSDIDDMGHVKRARLNCYSIENILLCDECNDKYIKRNSPYTGILSELKNWIKNNPEHQYIENVKDLVNNFGSRRTKKIKEIRNIIVSVLDSNKPWEVIVGQLIAENLDNIMISTTSEEHSISNYLGNSFKNKILADFPARD